MFKSSWSKFFLAGHSYKTVSIPRLGKVYIHQQFSYVMYNQEYGGYGEMEYRGGDDFHKQIKM